MKLRPYQNAAISDVINSWDSGNNNTLLTVPTGGGKTVIASALIENLVSDKGRVLFMANRTELISQTYNTLQRIGINASTITSNRVDINSHSAAIAMHQTLKNRLTKKQYFDYFSQFSHIIIDECHYGDFKWIFQHEALVKAKILGLTATPIAAKKNEPLRDFYQNIVEPTSVKELLEIGSLVPARFFAGQRDLSGLSVKGGEFTESSQEAVFAGKAKYDDVVQQYLKFCAGRQCIVFNTTQRMAVEQAAAFNEAGIKCDYIISGNDEHKGSTDEHRAKVLQKFKNGEIQVISNTAILTAGFDAPVCSAIILNFATMQRAKYVQCIGRGSRPCPEIGKTDFIVVDMGENNYRFGLFDMMWERKGKVNRLISSWSELFWNPFTPKPDGLPPTKDCPKCNALLPAQARICVCGHVFPVKEKEAVKVNLAEVQVEKSPEKMIQEWMWVAKNKNLSENFVLKKIRENLGVEGIYMYAEMQGRGKVWADSYYRTRKEKLWADIKKTFPIKTVTDYIAEDIRKQLNSRVDFFKVETNYREKVLAYPADYLKQVFKISDETLAQ